MKFLGPHRTQISTPTFRSSLLQPLAESFLFLKISTADKLSEIGGVDLVYVCLMQYLGHVLLYVDSALQCHNIIISPSTWGQAKLLVVPAAVVGHTIPWDSKMASAQVARQANIHMWQPTHWGGVRHG